MSEFDFAHHCDKEDKEECLLLTTVRYRSSSPGQCIVVYLRSIFCVCATIYRMRY
jgi:hypothetical protein